MTEPVRKGPVRLRQVAELVGGTVVGDPDTEIRGISGIKEAGPGDITFVANRRYIPLLAETRASAAVVGPGVDSRHLPLVVVGNPDLAFAQVVALFGPDPVVAPVGVHPSAVIGSDGFGYATVEGVHHKIPQVGIVQIDDDVEIGANVTIDRARFDKTHIMEGTKIDNLVQIAHNVTIGKCCVIVAQTAIAGSARIGDNVVIAGQSGVDGHIEVGSGVRMAARSGVTKDVAPARVVSGFPAQAHDRELKLQASLRRVPALLRTVQQLTEELARLRAKVEKGESSAEDP